MRFYQTLDLTQRQGGGEGELEWRSTQWEIQRAGFIHKPISATQIMVSLKERKASSDRKEKKKQS